MPLAISINRVLFTATTVQKFMGRLLCHTHFLLSPEALDKRNVLVEECPAFRFSSRDLVMSVLLKGSWGSSGYSTV